MCSAPISVRVVSLESLCSALRNGCIFFSCILSRKEPFLNKCMRMLSLFQHTFSNEIRLFIISSAFSRQEEHKRIRMDVRYTTPMLLLFYHLVSSCVLRSCVLVLSAQQEVTCPSPSLLSIYPLLAGCLKCSLEDSIVFCLDWWE